MLVQNYHRKLNAKLSVVLTVYWLATILIEYIRPFCTRDHFLCQPRLEYTKKIKFVEETDMDMYSTISNAKRLVVV